MFSMELRKILNVTANENMHSHMAMHIFYIRNPQAIPTTAERQIMMMGCTFLNAATTDVTNMASET